MLRSLRKVASGFLAALMLLSASAMAENVPNDVPLQQIAAEAGADNYYQEAIETEIYNYKLVRNLPTTFTQDTWETYCSLANGLMDLDAENLADVQKKTQAKVGRSPSALASWDSTAMCSSAVWRPTLLKTSGWTCSVRFAISGIMRKTTAWVEWIAWRLWDSRAAV